MKIMNERIKMLKTMKFIVRHVNNESFCVGTWFSLGVADGDIEYGDLTVGNADDLYVYYEDDKNFARLMDTFLLIMSRAYKSGGLYCDTVVSKH